MPQLSDSEHLSSPLASSTLADEKNAELRASIEQGVTELAEEIAQGKSARYMHYLQVMARFHTYSLGNQLLIARQYPDASRVAGYKAWETMGYHVAKGQKGIKILAPTIARVKVQDANTGEERRVESVVGFHVTHVFDVSQLNADEVATRPVPEFFVPLGNNHAALGQAVAQAILQDGIALSEDSETDAQGYSVPGHIVLRAGLDATNRCLTLLHEWAHELLHQRSQEGRKKSRSQQEVEAEATAYVTARHFGVANPFSADYLQDWGADPKSLFASLHAIHAAATAIITKTRLHTAETPVALPDHTAPSDPHDLILSDHSHAEPTRRTSARQPRDAARRVAPVAAAPEHTRSPRHTDRRDRGGKP